MADTYTLHIAGLTRELPICKVNDHMDIELSSCSVMWS